MLFVHSIRINQIDADSQIRTLQAGRRRIAVTEVMTFAYGTGGSPAA